MRKIRIYQAGTYLPGQIISLSESASQHVGRVLRMQTGDEIILFDGANNEYEATISEVNKNTVKVQIINTRTINLESPLKIHLAQAIPKGDKMELIIQKAVELGAAIITPLLTKHCAFHLDAKRLQKKQAQWQAIAISACEQSGRNQIPIIAEHCNLLKYLKECQTKTKLILYPNAQKSWRQYADISESVSILIGPEGGFSTEEVNLALDNNFIPLKLGPRILRTETAAIASISILQAIFGDL